MQISRKQSEIEAWYQLPTNRKWPMVEPKITSSITSDDFECTLFRKRFEVDIWLQWGTQRKWKVRYRMVTWPMTSLTQNGWRRDLVIFRCKYLENGLR